MNKLIKLVNGEMMRLFKYHILTVSTFVSFIWLALFLLVDQAEAQELAPLFLFADMAVMSVLLLGASFYLEKQEGTLSATLMLPITIADILIAKTVASIVMGLISAVVLSLGLYVIYGLVLNYLLLLLYVLITITANAAIGFVLSLWARDFNQLLGLLMAYMFIFTLPPIFMAFGIIPATYENYLIVSPAYGTSYLMTAVVKGFAFNAKTMLIIGYLVALAYILFRFVVYPRFKKNITRG